jgi:hypothetical protein
MLPKRLRSGALVASISPSRLARREIYRKIRQHIVIIGLVTATPQCSLTTLLNISIAASSYTRIFFWILPTSHYTLRSAHAYFTFAYLALKRPALSGPL